MFLIELYYFDKYMKRSTSGCTVPKMDLFEGNLQRWIDTQSDKIKGIICPDLQ